MATTSLDAALDFPVDVPASPRRSLLRDAALELRTLARYRHLLRYLVTSTLRTENENTVLSFVWWILDPLLTAALYLVFIGVILGRGGPDFPIFLLTAIVSWEFFVKATSKAAHGTLRKERSMRQIAFPKSVVPLSVVGAETFHFAFGLAVLLAAAVPFGILPHPIVLLAVPIALVQIVFTLGVAYVLSALNVFFRDTAQLMRYLFRMGFYLSPALYPVALVPDRIRDIYVLNPFVTFFDSYRSVFMHHAVPDLSALGIVAAASVALLVFGYLFFVRLQPWFAKLV